MPLPSAAQLSRMRAQANSHGASSFTLLKKTETNTALGPTVVYTNGTTFTGLKYAKPVTQEIRPGLFVTRQEQHVTIPADVAATTDQVLLEDSSSEYYEITAINTVDDNLLILQDLTIRRIKV